MLPLVDTGSPSAIIGGVHERGGFFVWRIQGRNSEEGPKRQTRDEAEADGQLYNAAGRGIGDADDARTAVAQKLAELRRDVDLDQKDELRQTRKKIKIEQQDEEFEHAAKMYSSNVSDSAHIGHL